MQSEGATNAGLLSMTPTNLLLLQAKKNVRNYLLRSRTFLKLGKKSREIQSMRRKKCKHDPRERFDFPPLLTSTFPILYALHSLTL